MGQQAWEARANVKTTEESVDEFMSSVSLSHTHAHLDSVGLTLIHSPLTHSLTP